MDPHMINVADYDCFSRVVFRSVEDYKRMKADPYYRERLMPQHLNFADTERSKYVEPVVIYVYGADAL